MTKHAGSVFGLLVVYRTFADFAAGTVSGRYLLTLATQAIGGLI